MSIQSEITRIKTNVQNTLDTLAQTGVGVPEGATSDDLPGLVQELISSLAGGLYKISFYERTLSNSESNYGKIKIGDYSDEEDAQRFFAAFIVFGNMNIATGAVSNFFCILSDGPCTRYVNSTGELEVCNTSSMLKYNAQDNCYDYQILDSSTVSSIFYDESYTLVVIDQV